MTENEQIQEIDDLLIGFDELGFRPTIPLPDPEATAVRWRNKLVNALKGYRKVEQGGWMESPRTSRSPTRGRITSYNVYFCSVCGKSNGKRKTPFCPHCGADMRGEK